MRSLNSQVGIRIPCRSSHCMSLYSHPNKLSISRTTLPNNPSMMFYSNKPSFVPYEYSSFPLELHCLTCFPILLTFQFNAQWKHKRTCKVWISSSLWAFFSTTPKQQTNVWSYRNNLFYSHFQNQKNPRYLTFTTFYLYLIIYELPPSIPLSIFLSILS